LLRSSKCAARIQRHILTQHIDTFGKYSARYAPSVLSDQTNQKDKKRGSRVTSPLGAGFKSRPLPFISKLTWGPAGRCQLRGREDVRQFYNRVFKDFAVWHRIIEDIIAEGDKVWVRFKVTGTTLLGKKIELTTVGIFHLVNGKFVDG
jgi:hypothetical protein